MRLADLAGLRVAVWGTGREGMAAITAIRDVPGTTLVAVDENAGRPVDDWRAAVGDIPLVGGDGAFEALAGADVVVRSPGISRYHRFVVDLEARGVRLTSGTELWTAEHASQTVGVTGSKGKSTTSSLIHHLLVGLGGHAELGGNIGVPMLAIPPAPRYVVEMSSYQCSDLRDPLLVAAVTALFPDHFDWHGGEEPYYRDKLNILAQQPVHAVLNGLDDRLTARVDAMDLATAPVEVGRPDSYHLATGPDQQLGSHLRDLPLFPRSTFALLGRHNAGNLTVALGVLDALGYDVAARHAEIAAVVATFQPLPHRLAPIEDPSGLTFVDDTLATTPQAAIAAVEAFDGRPLTLLVGGSDRGIDYTPLRDFFAAREAPSTVIGIPDSGPRILSVLIGVPGLSLAQAEDLAAAVRLARQLTPPGGVVLLSPAAPSYGRFANFEHRSAVYREAIQNSAG